MKSLMMTLILCMVGVTALATEKMTTQVNTLPWHYDIFPLNGEIRYEHDPAEQMVDRRPLGFAVGMGRGNSTVLLEYSQFSEKTGNATLSLNRDHREYIAWWKQSVLHYAVADFFVSGGLGAYQEEVTTTLAGIESVKDTGGLQPIVAASGGIQSLMFKYMLLSLEGRLIGGQNLDPNPEPSVLLRAGVQF